MYARLAETARNSWARGPETCTRIFPVRTNDYLLEAGDWKSSEMYMDMTIIKHQFRIGHIAGRNQRYKIDGR